MAGLDLRGVKGAVEAWLVDDIVITRGYGILDDTLDEDTGTLAPGHAEATVYSGKGGVQSIGREQLEDPETASIVVATGATHRLMLPIGTVGDTIFEYDDVAAVTAAHGFTPDPVATDARWRVVHPGTTSTWTVVRFLYLSEIRTAPTAPPGP